MHRLLFIHPALLLCFPVWNTMRLEGFMLSELKTEPKGLYPLQKYEDWLSPLLLNDLARVVALIALAGYDLKFLRTLSRQSISMHS